MKKIQYNVFYRKSYLECEIIAALGKPVVPEVYT